MAKNRRAPAPPPAFMPALPAATALARAVNELRDELRDQQAKHEDLKQEFRSLKRKFDDTTEREKRAECCVCHDKIEGAVGLACGHVVCFGCYSALLTRDTHERKCPLCRARIDVSKTTLLDKTPMNKDVKKYLEACR